MLPNDDDGWASELEVPRYEVVERGAAFHDVVVMPVDVSWWVRLRKFLTPG